MRRRLFISIGYLYLARSIFKSAVLFQSFGRFCGGCSVESLKTASNDNLISSVFLPLSNRPFSYS